MLAVGSRHTEQASHESWTNFGLLIGLGHATRPVTLKPQSFTLPVWKSENAGIPNNSSHYRWFDGVHSFVEGLLYVTHAV